MCKDSEHIDYMLGASKFEKFLIRPGIYKDQTAALRVRMDGRFGGWKLRESLFKAFGFEPGKAMFLNDIFVLGKDERIVDEECWLVDCFADGEAAEWLETNNVGPGTVFEGEFKFVYSIVPKVADSRGGSGPVDAYIANLVFVRGIRIVEQGVPAPTSHEPDDLKQLLLQTLLGSIPNSV